MGILGLSRLIADVAPESIKDIEIASLFGRRIAIDASMSIYQFLIAIRNRDQMMTNDSGETTSHLIGLFYRTIKLLEVGIKPIYVFDGKAPELKIGELTKRKERRQEAEAKLAEAKEQQDQENINKFNKRLVRVTRQHNDDCKKLLRLLGLPIIESPSEAEAQCAQLCKEGHVYATATEDMDGLTFGSPRLVRNLTSGSNEKVKEYSLDKVLNGLGLTHKQFIDLGILMGCDYCESIKGIGGKKGLELIKKFGSIEQILEKKFGITDFVKAEVDYGERKHDEVQVIHHDDDTEEANGATDGADEIKESKNGKSLNHSDNSDIEPDKSVDEVNDDVSEDEVKDEIKDDVSEDEVKDEIKDDVSEGEVKDDESEDEVKDEVKDDESEDEVKDEVKDDESEDEVKDEVKDDESEDEVKEKIKTKNDKNKKKKSKDKTKNNVPENWLFIGARKLFEEPNVLKNTITESDMKQKEMDEDAIVQFLCVDNGFSEDRVRNALKRVKDAKGKCSQTRIDSFFKMLPSTAVPKKNDNKSEKGTKRGSSAKKGPSKRGRPK